jgi:hypothetical protein
MPTTSMTAPLRRTLTTAPTTLRRTEQPVH